MEYVELNNGVRMPMLGYGTYRTPGRDAARLVAEALAAGYRHIDTAQCYGNERGVGEAFAASGLPREEVFLVTKTWTRGYADTARSIDESLRALGCGYVDLLLVHEPSGDIRGIWRALEEAYRKGLARAIGVSNFLGPVFERLADEASVMPAVNQLETHVYRQQEAMRGACERRGVRLSSWSPLVAGQHGFFSDPTLVDIGRRRGVSVAQVGLRWLVQRGIPAIPKTKNPDRMRENLDIFGFSLDDEDMARIASLETGKSQFGWW